MPRITVVVPVYNHARYVEAALSSLDAQDFRDFEVIAVNDGSTDESLKILQRHRPKVTIIDSKHQGPAAARNIAIRSTDSELIAFMDADDLCAPERLRMEIGALKTQRADLVASALDFMAADGAPLSGRWARPSQAANDHWASLLERNWIGTPSVIVRRDVLSTVGLFDESFTHGEDYDLWLRIGRAHTIHYIDSPLIHCRRHEANTSIRIGSHQHFERLSLQKVSVDEAWAAFDRLYSEEQRRTEAWIWFLLRRSDALLREEVHLARTAHPQSRMLKFAEGVFQYDAEEYGDALATFDSLSESDACALHNAGVVHAKRGNFNAAKVRLETALQRCPEYHDAQYNLDALRKGQEFRLTRRPFREHVVPMISV